MNNSSLRQLLFFVGISGCGKSTLQNHLISMNPEKYSRILSSTTRDPREGEVDGVDYNFLSEKDFLKLRDNNGLLQSIKIKDNHYGTQMSVYENMSQNGIFVCTPEGINDTLNALKDKGVTGIRPIIVLFDVTSDLLKRHGIDSDRVNRGDFGQQFKEMDARDEFDGIPKIILKDENIDDRLPEEFDGFLTHLLSELDLEVA